MDIITLALAEDIGSGDKSAEFLEPRIVTATLITREECILYGTQYFDACFDGVDIVWHYSDAQSILAGSTLATLKGDIKELVSKERTALNFLQTLSATATQTHTLVRTISHTNTQLLDTRKTLPGFRKAQKEAVHAGGGVNHRMGLYDAIMLKENHLMSGSISELVAKAKQRYPDTDIIVEVETLEELKEVDALHVTRILCDNFSIEMLIAAVQYASTPLEASGNITQENIISYAGTGVDYISIGSITKHIRAIDLSLRIQA